MTGLDEACHLAAAIWILPKDDETAVFFSPFPYDHGNILFAGCGFSSDNPSSSLFDFTGGCLGDNGEPI